MPGRRAKLPERVANGGAPSVRVLQGELRSVPTAYRPGVLIRSALFRLVGSQHVAPYAAFLHAHGGVLFPGSPVMLVEDMPTEDHNTVRKKRVSADVSRRSNSTEQRFLAQGSRAESWHVTEID